MVAFLKIKVMIRGDSCALANCTATRSADVTTTTRLNIEPAIVPITTCAVSRLRFSRQPMDRSKLVRIATVVQPATMPTAGTIHNEFWR